MAQNLKQALAGSAAETGCGAAADLLKARLDRLMAYGRVKEQALR
jgi:hypothetical protein